MEDTQLQRGTSQPIVSATEAWLLSRAQTLASLAALASSMKPQLLSAQIAELSEAAWNQYFQHADVPAPVQAQRDAIVAKLDPETAIPVVEWPALEETRVGAWEFVDLGKTEGLDLTMTAPFRRVSLSSLPEGTRIMPLKDPRHSAAAAMVEALGSAKRDIIAAFTAVNPVTAFRRVNRIIQVYRQAAKVTMAQLHTDDFHTWEPNAPRNISLAQAEALICQVGATARSHQVLAVHLMAQWLQHLADDDEVNRAPNRKDALMSEVDAMLAKFTRTLDHYSRQVTEPMGLGPEACSVMVIFQPIPGPGPVLAIIPTRSPLLGPVISFADHAKRSKGVSKA